MGLAEVIVDRRAEIWIDIAIDGIRKLAADYFATRHGSIGGWLSILKTRANARFIPSQKEQITA